MNLAVAMGRWGSCLGPEAVWRCAFAAELWELAVGRADVLLAPRRRPNCDYPGIHQFFSLFHPRELLGLQKQRDFFRAEEVVLCPFLSSFLLSRLFSHTPCSACLGRDRTLNPRETARRSASRDLRTSVFLSVICLMLVANRSFFYGNEDATFYNRALCYVCQGANAEGAPLCISFTTRMSCSGLRVLQEEGVCELSLRV